MDHVRMSKYLIIYFHHSILGGENILVFKFIFTTIYIFLGGGGETIFRYIFTTVFLGEKIYLNIFLFTLGPSYRRMELFRLKWKFQFQNNTIRELLKPFL